MAQVTNLTSGNIQISASGNELGPGKQNYRKNIAGNTSTTIPDGVAGTTGVKAMVTNNVLRIDSFENGDDDPINSTEFRRAIRTGSGVATSGTFTIVNESNIKATDVVLVMASDGSFAALTDVFVDPTNTVEDTSFRIDHSNASGGEAFTYVIRTTA